MNNKILTDWETTTLENLQQANIIECMNGYSSGVHNQDGDGIPHIRPFNISPLGHSSVEQLKFIPAERHKENYSLQVRDVIFNNTNTEELVGKTAVWRHPGRFGFSNHMTRIRVRKFDEVSPEFLAFYLHYHWQTGMSRQLCRRHVSQASIMGDRFFQIPVPKPSEKEQTKIAFILTKIQQAIEVETNLIRTTRELKAAVMKKLFTEGLNGEPQKETEIGSVPESWKLALLGEYFDIKHGFAFSGEHFQSAGKYILMTPGHFHEEGGFRDQGSKTKYYVGEFPSEYILNKDDLLVAMTEQKAGLNGSPAFVPIADGYLHNQRLGLIENLSPQLDKRFLYHLLNTTHVRGEIARSASGSKVKHTSPSKIRAVRFAIPGDLGEQIKIADVLDAIDTSARFHSSKAESLHELFRVLLDKLMSGSIRVTDLKIDAAFLEQAIPATLSPKWQEFQEIMDEHLETQSHG